VGALRDYVVHASGKGVKEGKVNVGAVLVVVLKGRVLAGSIGHVDAIGEITVDRD
jgi:hypothetical protein